MKKKLLTVSLIGVMLSLAFSAGVFAATKGINIIINGKKAGTTGVIKDGKVMAPLEDLANELGGTFEWNPDNETATVNLPRLNDYVSNDTPNGHTIKNIKVTEGVSTLTISGEVANTSNSRTSFTLYGQLMDAEGKVLTRTATYSVNPAELNPGETGAFEIIFMDYYNFKDQNTKYEIYVQGFSL